MKSANCYMMTSQSVSGTRLASFFIHFPWLFQKNIFPWPFLDFPWPLKFPDFFQFSLTCRNYVKKAQPTRFLGFIGFWALLGFWIFLVEHAAWKLVGWFSSSAKLLFRFTSTVDYLKICTVITYWSLEAVDIKKSLIIIGTTNWNWIKFGEVFWWGFQWVLLPKPHWVFWVLPGCLNLATWHGVIRTQIMKSRTMRRCVCRK